MGNGALFRAITGGLGGLSAVLVKYIGQDHSFAIDWLESGDPRFHKMLIGYIVLTPILIFLGAVITWASDETNHLKLLAMGIAAPAMITTYAGGISAESRPQAPNAIGPAGWYFELSPVAVANAGEQSIQIVQADAIKQGVDLFFGKGKGEQFYWVIVGAYLDKTEAEAKAAAINAERPGLGAFVGKRMPGNNYYPVIIGDYVPLAEAKRLMDVGRGLRSVSENPYLSTFAYRR